MVFLVELESIAAVGIMSDDLAALPASPLPVAASVATPAPKKRGRKPKGDCNRSEGRWINQMI